MTLEIANRLCAYRKHHGLSQEELADRIGVSRQAVSKWERAEASPDTDNLILLSKEYGVTLDDLLYKDPVPQQTEGTSQTEKAKTTVSFKDGIHVDTPDESVHINLHGIHVDDATDHVHIGWDGIHTAPKRPYTIYVDEDGTQHFYDDDGDELDAEDLWEKPAKWYAVWKKLPWPILCVIGYLLLGFFVSGGWAWGWLLFLTVPLYYSLGKAILRKNPRHFAYPVLVSLVYLALGLMYSLWHPYWLLFLTVPLYYSFFSLFKKK